MAHTGRRGGRIELICGSMFSGKTEELLRRVKRAEIARQKIQIFKPALDDRYSVTRVWSHEGAQREAEVIAQASEILVRMHSDTDIVAVDEAQFLDSELPEIADELAGRGLRVIIAGLDLDFRGEPFGPIPRLLAQAELVDKLHAICVRCGAEASRTQRLIEQRPANYNDPIILVGADETYEARCRDCHEVPGKPKQAVDPQTARGQGQSGGRDVSDD